MTRGSTFTFYQLVRRDSEYVLKPYLMIFPEMTVLFRHA